MASQVTESLAVAATATAPSKMAAQLVAEAGVDAKEEGLNTPSDGESGSSEDNLYFHQHIERNGQRVLVSWMKEEERRVVRKADYLFLPIFAVCICARWVISTYLLLLSISLLYCYYLMPNSHHSSCSHGWPSTAPTSPAS